MVPLGLGQAILGGYSQDYLPQKEIYHISCSQHNCLVSMLSHELSVQGNDFLAIAIPDSLSGCISESKFGFFVRISFG